VDLAISIRTGTLMTGLFGPIPCGCRTVSKMKVGVGAGGFGVGAVCRYVFTGYIGGYCL
jgi:hypothetical protein